MQLSQWRPKFPTRVKQHVPNTPLLPCTITNVRDIRAAVVVEAAASPAGLAAPRLKLSVGAVVPVVVAGAV